MNPDITIKKAEQPEWQVPKYSTPLWLGRKHKYCIVIPVINESVRIINLLTKMESLKLFSCTDAIIVDGGSTDGSLDVEKLKEMGLRGLLIKKGSGKLSSQLRCAYAFALREGYSGVITIDGNDKDDPSAIPNFINCLESGYDFIQGSRFLDGGLGLNTPKVRDFAIRFIHAPLLSFSSGFKWTDTTQGFRAYSDKLLKDKKVAVFRDVFAKYELLAYLSHIAPKLNFRCKEIPTIRRYPAGDMPTKINGLSGNFEIFRTLLKACLGKYNI